MLRLFLFFYASVATTLAGVFVVVALVIGYASLVPLLVAAGAGGLVAGPVS